GHATELLPALPLRALAASPVYPFASTEPVRARETSSADVTTRAATTATYTLSLHDALPISRPAPMFMAWARDTSSDAEARPSPPDRKSTCLNSSHVKSSYPVFRLKKKSIRRQLPASARVRHGAPAGRRRRERPQRRMGSDQL